MTAAARWLCPDMVFDGGALHPGLAVRVEAGRVVAVGAPPPGAERLAGVLVPGYLDLQVNGGGGVLLNNDPSVAGMLAMAAAHRRFGTVGILPTVITDAPGVLAAAVQAAIAARGAEGMRGAEGLLGLHIEGPHISLPRRGTHARQWVRPMEAETLEHVARLRAAGVAVMITLAPEAVQPGQIAALVALGAVVSIGHSDATEAEVHAALAEGAGCFTHLYNAMSPMLGRAPGVTGAAINSGAFCGVICDGRHVSDAMLGLAIRARPVAGRMFLVSDAMATVGGGDSFHLYGQEIRLQDGRLVNAEGALAGAHVTMAEGVARLIGAVGVAPEVALQMAVTVPAHLLGRGDLAGVVGRNLSDLLLLGPDWMPLAPCYSGFPQM